MGMAQQNSCLDRLGWELGERKKPLSSVRGRKLSTASFKVVWSKIMPSCRSRTTVRGVYAMMWSSCHSLWGGNLAKFYVSVASLRWWTATACPLLVTCGRGLVHGFEGLE